MKTLLKAILAFAILAICIIVLNSLVKNDKQSFPVPAMSVNETATTSPSRAEEIPVITESVREQASSSPAISVEYPQFPTLSKSFNDSIKRTVTSDLDSFRSDARENSGTGQTDMSFTSRWSAVQTNSSYVSFVLRYEFYLGGAHEGQSMRTFNYSVVDRKMIGLSDIFASSTDYLTQISDESRKQLLAKFKDGPDNTLLEGTRPVAESFKYFTFKDGVITIHFPAYAVAAWAAGEQQVSIPISLIK